MSKKVRIYTKTGDKGETSLLGGRVKKSHQRIVAYGTIDELNSALGVAGAFVTNKLIKELLAKIQNELFNIGSELATIKQTTQTIQPLTEPKVELLEKEIDRFDKNLPSLRNFILPSGNKASVFFHQARTVCRRSEREVIKLSEKDKINPILIKYLNRLSDLLFVLARAVNDQKEVLWKKE